MNFDDDRQGDEPEPEHNEPETSKQCKICEWWGLRNGMLDGRKRTCGFHEMLTLAEMSCPMWEERSGG